MTTRPLCFTLDFSDSTCITSSNVRFSLFIWSLMDVCVLIGMGVVARICIESGSVCHGHIRMCYRCVVST